MAAPRSKLVDPRIRRTRELLQQALETLLETRAFDDLSVQDIAEAATVNRATFYDHYPDKFALLECTVARRFHALLTKRGVEFDGTCLFALRAIAQGVCDFLAAATDTPGDCPRPIEPHLERAVIAVVRGMLLDGLHKQHLGRTGPGRPAASAEMIATIASWAIYGGAREWVQTPGRKRSRKIAETVMNLVYPILHPQSAGCPALLQSGDINMPGD